VSAKVAFVTGATGFVGGALLPALVQRGYEVHALVRPSADRSRLAELPIVWHPGDLGDGPSVIRAVRAAASRGRPALVVHSGALISNRRDNGPEQERINVDATWRVLDTARDARFERLVHVGSVVAVGVASAARPLLDEDAPWDPTLESVDYVRTKRRGDEGALSRGAVVVDPGAVFGPGSLHSNTTRFLERVRRRGAPWWVPPGGLAVVDVGDVAEGLVLAAERGQAGRRYLLVESNWSLRELFRCAAELAGRRPPWGTLSRSLWLTTVAGAALVDRLRPLELLAPQGLRLLAEHYRCDGRRARQELGWAPRPFAQTLQRTLLWLAEQAER
jgi:dihydroflavonol-4-reductase